MKRFKPCVRLSSFLAGDLESAPPLLFLRFSFYTSVQGERASNGGIRRKKCRTEDARVERTARAEKKSFVNTQETLHVILRRQSVSGVAAKAPTADPS